MRFGERVLAIINNLENLVEVANVCDKAYCEGTGYIHNPFGVDNPNMVAQNIAGLQAVLTTISILASWNSEDPESVLQRITDDQLEGYEEGIAFRTANCAWGAGQPFRTDKGPLGRATRLNYFDDLPSTEVQKDMYQIRAAAKWLSDKLGITSQTI